MNKKKIYFFRIQKSQLFLFLYAATTQVFVTLVGKLMLAEIVAIVTLPFINIGTLLKKHIGLKKVLGGLSVLFIAQIVSDLVNQSSPHDYLRGWALIIFAIVSMVFLVSQLSNNPKDIVYYLFALFFIRLIFGEGTLDPGVMAENTNYFKVRFVGFLNPAMMLVGYYLFNKNKKRITALLFFVFALICMTFDARSNSLIFMISSLLIYIKAARVHLSKGKIFSFGIVLSALFYVVFVYYVNQVLYHGFGGSNAITQLKKTSNPYNPVELLYYGRTDVPVLIIAGLDKPIFGHGSWGKDPYGKYARLKALLSGGSFVGKERYIRAHSILFGFWAYAGLLGLFSVSFVFIKLFGYFLKIYKTENYHCSTLPILIVLCIDMLWNFFFSPVGHLRQTVPLAASLVITEYTQLYLLKITLIARNK